MGSFLLWLYKLAWTARYCSNNEYWNFLVYVLIRAVKRLASHRASKVALCSVVAPLFPFHSKTILEALLRDVPSSTPFLAFWWQRFPCWYCELLFSFALVYLWSSETYLQGITRPQNYICETQAMLTILRLHLRLGGRRAPPFSGWVLWIDH